jgi:hypothetical protein
LDNATTVYPVRGQQAVNHDRALSAAIAEVGFCHDGAVAGGLLER